MPSLMVELRRTCECGESLDGSYDIEVPVDLDVGFIIFDVDDPSSNGLNPIELISLVSGFVDYPTNTLFCHACSRRYSIIDTSAAEALMAPFYKLFNTSS